jgi:hypothetical protein
LLASDQLVAPGLPEGVAPLQVKLVWVSGASGAARSRMDEFDVAPAPGGRSATTTQGDAAEQEYEYITGAAVRDASAPHGSTSDTAIAKTPPATAVSWRAHQLLMKPPRI